MGHFCCSLQVNKYSGTRLGVVCVVRGGGHTLHTTGGAMGRGCVQV